MDFHSLSRRELQALCKMNKIPANITNLAMADALQALETVEGLEELLTQSEARYLETPAKSMTAARSVSRTSKQRPLKEEPDSKLTTKSRRGTRKVDGETDAAPPSACSKVPMTAQSMQKNVEGSTAARVYNTRRSTRLLEKQMCQLSLKDNEDRVDANADKDSQDLQRQLSLKDNEDMVDANADKDSQDLQRQFIQDIDNSLAPENETFFDESNVTKEDTEEPIIENMDVEDEKSFLDGVESVEPVSKNYACDVVNACNDVEEPIIEKEFKSDEDQPMQEDVVDHCSEHEESIVEKNDEDQQIQEDVAEEMETVSHPEVSINVITDTEEATQELINVEEAIESEADSNADYENSAVPAVDPQTCDGSSVESDDVKQVDPQIKLELSSALVAADNDGENEAEYKKTEYRKVPEASEDEFGFLSDSDDDIDENENPLPADEEEAANEEEEADESDDDNAASEEEEAASEELASKSPLMPRDQIQCTLESSTKKPASIHRVPISDNKENFQMTMSAPKPLLALPAGTAPGTPLEKKSLRQLKKMVRGLYKQQHPQDAEEMQPAPLQLRAKNM